MACDVFLSYRRKDAAAYALCVRMAVARELGDPAVFMDTASIGPGAAFPAELQAALDAAQVVLAVIGPAWQPDRLADADDWVRRELEGALARGLHVVPVLVGDAEMPTRAALPPSLAALADRNAHVLRDASLQADLATLVESLRRHFGFAPNEPRPTAVFPVPAPHVPQKLTAAALKTAMTVIPHWTIQTSPLPGTPGVVRTELTRAFTFPSFAAAIEFMRRTAKFIDDVDHHPRWENLWKTVTVWLSTWDIGHEVSDRDITLARYLEQQYAELTAPRRGPKAR